MNISCDYNNLSHQYIVIGNGNWSFNYRTTLNQFKTINIHELKCNLNTDDIYARIKEIYDEYPQCVVIFACDPILQSEVILRLTHLDISLIIEKPLAYNNQSYINLLNFVKSHPNKTLAGFFTILNSNHFLFRKVISKKAESIKKIVIYDGGIGPYRKRLGSFLDWAPHTFATLQSINFPFSEAKIERIKSEQGDVFKLQGNLCKMEIEANFGNGFALKNRSAQITFRDKTVQTFNFMQPNPKRRYREMHRLINFSIYYFNNARLRNYCIYSGHLTNDQFILNNANLVKDFNDMIFEL